MAEGTSTLPDNKPVSYDRAVENSLEAPPIGYIVVSHKVKYTYMFKDDFKVFSKLQDCVERVFSKPLFCCGGSVKFLNAKDFVLSVKKSISEDDKEDVWNEFKLTDPIDVEKLLEYSNPATFGDLKAMKTLVDPNVRFANAIESERFKFEEKVQWNDWTNMRNVIYGSAACIKDTIEDTLTPGRHSRLECYKLNIYSEGGFFQPHVDSQTQDNMVGTLVICLPSYHKGGELCVSHDGVQHVFDFSEHSGDTNCIQWAAFYSNCIHEVKPVLEGHRVTITYNISSENSNMKQRGMETRLMWRGNETNIIEKHFYPTSESLAVSDEVLGNLHSELEKIRLLKDTLLVSPSKIGILLKHKYVPKGLQQDLLKGEDKVLHDFLVGKQWKCTLVSVLSRFQTAAIYPYGWGEDGELDERHQIYQFRPFGPVHSSIRGSDNPRRMFGRFRSEYRKWRFGIPFIDAYRRLDNGEFLVRNESGHGSWVGNETEDVGVDQIYLDSALILEL